ncbi:MAG: hypothetical protein RLZZ296_1815 [Pseudomonadota bacterium]|jgi:hypothetical protein
MIRTRPAQIRISEEELLALLGPVPRQATSAAPAERAPLAGAGVDIWFKYRMLFLLAVVVAYTSKLLFFPAVAAANFDLSAGNLSMDRYFQFRAAFVVLISAVYLYSYLKDWHFEQVSLVFLGIGVTALVLDYFNAYVYLSQTPTQWIAGLIALRFIAIFCLLMNAMSARHAPPMPRRLWS